MRALAGFCRPQEAGQLAGRLSWAASAVWGRAARCYLAPIYWHAHGSETRVSARLRRALVWWLEFLAAHPRRMVLLHAPERPRVLLYTDATGHGRMAWCICEYGEKRFAAVDAPTELRKWVVHRKTQASPRTELRWPEGRGGEHRRLRSGRDLGISCGDRWAGRDPPRRGGRRGPPLLTPPRVSLQAAPAGCGFSARDPPRAQVHLFVNSAVALGTILRGSSRRGLGRCPDVREVRSRAYVGSEIGMIWSPTCGSVLPRRDWVRDAPQARWRGQFRRE